MRHKLLITLSLILGAALAWFVIMRPNPAPTPEAPPASSPVVEQGATTVAEPARFVGANACAACHPTEHDRWLGSHHDLAMQEVTEETVLGDFDDATYTHYGVTSTFFRRDGQFMVRTDGPDGALEEYPIRYTFGVTPLQQYLVEFPGGRLQALGLCWDTREKEAGGQRWFHVYPDEAIPHDDILHWTGPNQNWNYMCAECHSTNLQKGYDLETNVYETTWSEIDVACEACHGPGSQHIAWAEAMARGEMAGGAETMGLAVRLKDTDGGAWIFDMETGTAKRSVPRSSDGHAQIESCARCHARRRSIHEPYVHGRPFLDAHDLRLLDEPAYHPDGQILDEVYVYGSFIQSKMFHEGVTCSDCHDPHSLDLHASGNALCARCHLPDRFDTPSHHFHEPGGEGASCVACHMPSRTYMVVDPRRDHSIRIPRPDLSVKMGTPNACNLCHTEESATWAAEAVAGWYGPDRRTEPHFGLALAAGRGGGPGARAELVRLAESPAEPAIARATALTMLLDHPSRAALDAVVDSLGDADPLVRRAALSSLVMVPPEERLRLAGPSLDDPVRAVRIAAARVLAAVPATLLTPSLRQALDRGLDEYIAAQLANAERSESHVNLGNVHAERGRPAEAEAAYRTALRLDPGHVPATVNLVDLYRAMDRDDDGARVLREALERSPDEAALHHALGLLLVRQGETSLALDALGQAQRREPDNARYAYVYAVGLQSVGELELALETLEDAHDRHPADRDLLVALVTFNRDAGRLEDAAMHARTLVELAPEDATYRQMLDQLERQ